MILAFADDLEAAWGDARIAGVAQIWWYALREMLTVAAAGPKVESMRARSGTLICRGGVHSKRGTIPGLSSDRSHRRVVGVRLDPLRGSFA